jgi:hypothetical protein
MTHPRKPFAPKVRVVNLEAGMPLVQEALSRLEQELAWARRDQCALLKIIHGYGSSGTGGDIRIAVQRRLRELEEAGAIPACIFGEDWATSDSQTWSLIKSHPTLKNDPDLGRRNRGITIVMLQ